MYRFRKLRAVREIAPDEIFLDSSNLPEYDPRQFEGRLQKPVSLQAILSVAAAFVVVASVFLYRAFELQIVHGAEYALVSRENTLAHSLIFATRGVIYDRRGERLAWNLVAPDATSTPFALRGYTTRPGLSHVLGYVQYPKKDSSGAWWRTEYSGVSGTELAFDNALRGINGSTIVEQNARGEIVRENIVQAPVRGGDLALSIDAEVQSKLYTLLYAHAQRNGFQGGASVILDVRTGEILALVSFPEYDNQAFADGDIAAVQAANADVRSPLLNRAIGGLYAPGSIVKPIFAAAALNEGLISPEQEILSTGAITIPNPYDPERPSVFRDWAVHGLVDMRTAIAVSSDEYFYTIGGGYGSQKGLGIAKIDEYARRFGLGERTGIALLGERAGVIPTPEWKLEVFGADDPWRLGNTYHTVIGQFGFQLTPLQAARFTAAIANGGRLPEPRLIASSTPAYDDVGIPDEHLRVVREGMRLAVTSERKDATVKSLYLSGIRIAGKSGTAQLGSKNEWMHSWVVGFWPSDAPRYAFATVLERAPAGTLNGAGPAMAPFFQWLVEARPEYVR